MCSANTIPTGDQAVYDALCGMAQPFSKSRHPLLDGHATSARSMTIRRRAIALHEDPAAHDRQTRACSTEISSELPSFCAEFRRPPAGATVLAGPAALLVASTACTGIAVACHPAFRPTNLPRWWRPLIALHPQPRLSDDKLLEAWCPTRFPNRRCRSSPQWVCGTPISTAAAASHASVAHIEEIQPGKAGAPAAAAVVSPSCPYQSQGGLDREAGRSGQRRKDRTASPTFAMKATATALRRGGGGAPRRRSEKVRASCRRRTALPEQFRAILLALRGRPNRQLSLRQLPPALSGVSGAHDSFAAPPRAQAHRRPPRGGRKA